MSYDNQKLVFGKEHIYVVEIDLDYCSLTFGVAPCTASGSGDAKCFNTLTTTQDAANYTGGGANFKTYRFYEKRSPAPIGISAGVSVSAMPFLTGVPSIAPSEIDLSGGLGIRASATITFSDHPHSDIGVDKYWEDRTWIASDKGTFWTKLRARNTNYENRPLRILSGYLVNGEFNIENFQVRHYIIDKLNVSGGSCRITAVDPLKRAMPKKAQVPTPSPGKLSGALTAVATSLTLTPTGVGSLTNSITGLPEYPSGGGTICIDKEVMTYTSRTSDTLNGLTRAQYNTPGVAHSSGATVQLCYTQSSKQVYEIVEDIITTYARVDSSLIPTTAWQAEDDIYLGGLLGGIIAKPVDVNKELQMLSKTAPHYLWWDERNQLVQFTALKPPPSSANVISMDSNIVKRSFRTADQPGLRRSSVYVYFGQIDPTMNIDEPNNWEQIYARVDTSAISTYDNVDQIEVIYSRWISSTNAAAARRLAALIGRRFANTPRMVNFELAPKDSDVWVGQSRTVNHRDIVDFTGEPVNTIFQIIQASEGKATYQYSGLEFVYGDALSEDEGGGEPGVDLVILSSDANNINLRTIYNGLFPAPDASTIAKFVIEPSVVIGSAFSGSYAIDTGSWPAGATVILQINSIGYAVGKGGDGSAIHTIAGGNGGPAIILNHDMELINNGVIGGGGGGGAANQHSEGGSTATAGGGGGEGGNPGLGGGNSFVGSALITNLPAEDGNLGVGFFGAEGGLVEWSAGGELAVAIGENGGKMGQAGSNGDSASGGSAGAAINRNGFTLTQTVAGDIRGSIIG